MPGYEPVTGMDVLRITCCTLFVYLVCFTLMCSLLWVGMFWNMHHVIFIGFIVGVSTVFLIVLCMFCMQRERIEQEEKRFQDKLKEMGLDEESIRRKEEEQALQRAKELAEQGAELGISDVSLQI